MITWDELTDAGKQILAEMNNKTGLMVVFKDENPHYSGCVYLNEIGAVSVYVDTTHVTTYEITDLGRALIPAPPVDHRAHYEAVCSELEREVTRHLEFMLAVKDLLQNAGYVFKLEYTERELLESLRNLVYKANGFEE